MTTAADEKLRELLEDFDAAMLVTRTGAGQLRSRPMAVADIERGGTMWFVTITIFAGCVFATDSFRTKKNHIPAFAATSSIQNAIRPFIFVERRT